MKELARKLREYAKHMLESGKNLKDVSNSLKGKNKPEFQNFKYNQLMNEDEKKAMYEAERKLYPVATLINDLIEKLIKKLRYGSKRRKKRT